MASTALIRTFSSPPSRLRVAVGVAILLFTAAFFGCGKPFNVKSRALLPPANYAATGAADSVSVQAQAITDEDFLYDTFDANLIVAGVLPVRVMITNSAAENVNLSKARFQLHAESGHSFRAIKPREAFKRLLAYYEISSYSKSGYKKSLDDFSAYALDTQTPLSVGQSRQGLMFFSVPSETARRAGLALVVSGLDSSRTNHPAVELKLN